MQAYYSASIFNNIESVKTVIDVKVISVVIINLSTNNKVWKEAADKGMKGGRGKARGRSTRKQVRRHGQHGDSR